VIVDNRPADSVASRKSQMERHTLALDFARDDLEAQGFEIVSTDPKFIDQKVGNHAERRPSIAARRSSR
jgi:hypothetical protein